MINYLEPDFNNSPAQRKPYAAYQRLNSNVADSIDVSIITPYYNTPELFVETVMSVQGQSLQNWEWIIVDDGSTDEQSVERLASIAEGNARIRVIRQENAGTAAARNTGIRNSSGRYFCLLDHDDMIEPTYLEKCAWFLDSNKEFSFCNSYNVVFGDQQFLWTKGYERGKEYLQANSAPPIAVVRRSAFEEVGGFDETIRILYEDWDFWLALANIGHWGYTIPEFLQWYRKLGSGRYEQILQSGYDNSDFAKTMQKKYPRLANEFPNLNRRHPKPYENIETRCEVSNLLISNPNGRRVMFILPQMVTGGADKVNLDLIEGLISDGHDVTVCATLATDHNWAHKFAQLTPDIFVLPNFLYVSDYPRFLAYMIQSRQIDTVIIAGSTLGYQLLPYLRSVSSSTSFIDITHVEETHWLNGGYPRFAIGYQDALDINIVTTKHLADWMGARGADQSRIRVMYTGVRPPLPRLARVDRRAVLEQFGILDEAPVIVFSGRLCDQKRPLLLPEILKLVRDEGLGCNVLIIGDGELRSQLESLLDKYELCMSVKVLGALPHEKWLEVLTIADIFLMPSLYEGISVALLEAMAAGVVPVVAKVGGHDEVLEHDSGFLISHGESEVSEYFKALADLIVNRDKLKAKSERCQAIISTKYSWEMRVNAFDEIITEAHMMRVKYPRNLISVGLAKEWATLALENKRLSDAVDWLWRKKDINEKRKFIPTGVENVASVIRIIVLLSQTKLGKLLLENALIKRIGRKLLAKLESTH